MSAREEIIAIENAVREQFGQSAVDQPMRIARLLADEGAELRHAEILALDVERRLESPYEPMFRNILKFSDFKQALSSIRNLENLRKKFQTENDKEGLRLVREVGQKGKRRAQMIAGNEKVEAAESRRKSRDRRMVYALAAIAGNF